MVGCTRSRLHRGFGFKVWVQDADTLREILLILNYKNQNRELASATTSKWLVMDNWWWRHYYPCINGEMKNGIFWCVASIYLTLNRPLDSFFGCCLCRLSPFRLKPGGWSVLPSSTRSIPVPTPAVSFSALNMYIYTGTTQGTRQNTRHVVK